MAKLRTNPARGFIETEADIRAGVRALRLACPAMQRAHDIAGDPPLRRRAGGFEGLARIVVGQQVSIASANAIWTRLATAVSPFTPEQMSRKRDSTLKAAGLSAPKLRTLRAVAAAIRAGELPINDLHGLEDAQIHERLCAVKGIGPWTADIYIMFCLGRADAFAPGDLALQIAAGHAAGLGERPSPAALAEMAERWRPWRGVAARLLWAYYPHMKALDSEKPVAKSPGSAQPV